MSFIYKVMKEASPCIRITVFMSLRASMTSAWPFPVGWCVHYSSNKPRRSHEYFCSHISHAKDARKNTQQRRGFFSPLVRILRVDDRLWWGALKQPALRPALLTPMCKPSPTICDQNKSTRSLCTGFFLVEINHLHGSSCWRNYLVSIFLSSAPSRVATLCYVHVGRVLPRRVNGIYSATRWPVLCNRWQPGVSGRNEGLLEFFFLLS